MDRDWSLCLYTKKIVEYVENYMNCLNNKDCPILTETSLL